MVDQPDQRLADSNLQVLWYQQRTPRTSHARASKTLAQTEPIHRPVVRIGAGCVTMDH